ncbi:hypothetical protein M408DRAFT_77692 [Serendipita vermifera MAFF 305830]|uniref:Ferrochelatase n=1 Tax=Serendipita vermifera MAFF 305830 TaxID=933852 RepID=A0A0C3AVR2_SERVB|nr:hypothetical protein M408DRAFT_77692 [Serendipita vermifera MAFF 305830]
MIQKVGRGLLRSELKTSIHARAYATTRPSLHRANEDKSCVHPCYSNTNKLSTLHRPTAIVLLNMGGPATLPAVQPFLTNLFSDGDLIPLPLQSFSAPWIAKRRTPQIEKQYAAIGGGSPILKWSEQQGQGMVDLLNEEIPELGNFRSYVGFRYADPLTPEMLGRLKEDGVKRAVAFTQYPQYSCSTTGSSLNELYRQVHKLGSEGIKWSVIDRWGMHEGFVEAVTSRILAALEQLPAHRRSKATLLFSAHSLPMSVVNRGDPYVAEVAMTVGSVMRRLANHETPHANPYRLVWQSQVGPSAWMGQQTSEAIKGLARLGGIEEKRAAADNVVLVPIAFTSDHIETLYELDLEYVKEGEELGLTVVRAESLNGSPIFIRAMADIVKDHMKETEGPNGQPVSQQMMLRCPGCTNDTCGQQKRWFSKWGSD